jgi:hypothetical protein
MAIGLALGGCVTKIGFFAHSRKHASMRDRLGLTAKRNGESLRNLKRDRLTFRQAQTALTEHPHASPVHASRPSLIRNQTIANEPTGSTHHAPTQPGPRG